MFLFKKERPKKKRIILKLSILIALIFVVVRINNLIIQKQVDNFTVNYPFTFSGEFDNPQYVTQDFDLQYVYSTEKKEYTVKWKSNNSCISITENGKASVNRAEQNTEVVLTLTYQKFLGKASRNYVVTVIGTNSIDLSSVEPITVDMLANEEYNRDMTAVINADGSLQYMSGNFKGLTVFNEEDAMSVIELYKEQFSVNSDVVFKLNNISTDKYNRNFSYDLFINNVKIYDAVAFIVTDTNSGKVMKIAIDDNGISSDIISFTDNFNEQEHVAVIKDKLSEMIEETFEIAVFDNGKCIDNNGYIFNYIVLADNNEYFNVSVQNNTVIAIKDACDFAQGRGIAKGFNEKGEQLEFNVTNVVEDGEKYSYLKDIDRNIHAVNSLGNYSVSIKGSEWFNKDGIVNVAGTLTSLYGNFIEQKIQNKDYDEVIGYNGWFTNQDAVAVQAFYNMQRTYDFYYYNLGLTSYDNKGSEIIILAENNYLEDGASWHDLNKVFMIGNANLYRYSCGINGEVIAHEYTHAIFNSKVDTINGNKEVDALNEAYADIFGCLIFPECEWKIGYNYYDINVDNYKGHDIRIGDPFVFRDLTVINSPINCEFIEYPTLYKQGIWDATYNNNDYEHRLSPIISNVAYKMYISNYFTTEQIAEIWIRSLNMGYTKESTFLTCRRNVIASAEEMKIDDEAIDAIATYFDEAYIFDSFYSWKVKNKPNNNTSCDNTTVIKTESNSIDGDLILDDRQKKRYLMLYSVAEIMLGDGTIIIYEEKINGKTYKDEVEMEKQLSAMFNQKYKETIGGKLIGVEYKLVDSKTFDLIQSLTSSTQGNIKDTAMQILNQKVIDITQEEKESILNQIDNLLPYVFNWKLYNTTAYDFYDTLDIIE